MAYENYDGPPVSAEAGSAVQLQNAFVNRVFGWMTIGLALTGFVAYFIAQNAAMWIVKYPGAYLVLALAELGLVIGLTAAIRRISAAAATAGFLLFAALNGVTLSWLFLAYSMDAVTATFFATSGTFGAMGLFGWLTKRDLTGLGSLCGMALIGLVIATLVNMFFPNGTATLVISWIGILVFVGLTAYDTQKLKHLAIAVGDGAIEEETGKKFAVIGALQLYLDFVNLFLYLLRIFGSRRN